MESDNQGTVASANKMAYYEGEDKPIGMPPMRVRIDQAVKQAEAKLAAVQRAREIFAAHPELEELLNIMQRNHF